MKKKVTIIFILIGILLNMSLSFAQQQEVNPVSLVPISDRLFEISGGSGANGGLYIGDDGVFVIDTKMDKQSVDQTIEEIKKITGKPLKYIINTHSDGDHVNGNRYFPEEVIIIAHENCRKEFFHPGRDGSSSEWTKPELAPFIPGITFREQMDIYSGSKKVELWYFGVGHTTGDIVIYFPEERTAFLGDQYFKGRPQLIHSYKGGNSFEYVKTLTKMLETLDAEKFCSGHSEIVGREDIKDYISQMQQRQEKIKSLIGEKKNLAEIKKAFDESEARIVESIYNELEAGLK